MIVDLLEVVFHRPLLLLVVSLAVLSFSTWVGISLLKRLQASIEEMRDDLRIVESATLTLLALIIGFTFSMAVGRYDQRKNLEEGEANAIGTELVRANLLPAADAARVRGLLMGYLELRIRYYTTRDDGDVDEINARTGKAQDELWSAVQGPALAQPTPVTALVVTGMNDVLNSQGYAQAAWLNRIPLAAWVLLLVIAVGATMLVGAAAKNAKSFSRVLLILPLVLSIALYLIADIDSPRHGMISVKPQNLQLVADSLKMPAPQAR